METKEREAETVPKDLPDAQVGGNPGTHHASARTWFAARCAPTEDTQE